MQLKRYRDRTLGGVALVILLVANTGCREVVAPVTDRQQAPAAAATKVQGYLLPAERPDSVALLPPAPAPGSPAAVADDAAYRALGVLEGTARWELAAADANVKFPLAANTFACALGFSVDQSGTPHLYTLLQRTVIDAGQSTLAAKQKYARRRPFEETGDATCVPADEQALRGAASYPSGHASLGHAWGELLAEVVPDRAAAVRARAHEFGQSRVICRVHWQSDVDAGRRVGQAVIPLLHENAGFRADLAAAQREAAIARERAARHDRDCDAEASALGGFAPSR
jgi:acid phosphatase (class A)